MSVHKWPVFGYMCFFWGTGFLHVDLFSFFQHHHLAQAMCIIQTDLCNIFESLPQSVSTTLIP